MGEQVTREVEGRLIVTSGSLVCPDPELCDVRDDGEAFEAYVERHCYDHGIDLSWSQNAEGNLGLNCFYFDHKYVYGNPTLTSRPFWEIHTFIAVDEWNEDDLEERVRIEERTFRPIPRASDRRAGDVRSMKQIELPRQCEKTSTGANSWSIFISKRQYFVFDERNYPIMIRSATALNARDSLSRIRLRSTRSKNIKRLYGINLIKCLKCSVRSQVPATADEKCPECGEAKKIKVQKISLIDPTRGVGGTGKDSVTFRWATDANNVDPSDEDSVYSVRAVGVGTETTGQRPRETILDDIQTEKNSRTHEMRMNLMTTFDEAVRQIEFGGRLKVYDTRKYVDDFAGKIQHEPLRSQFHSLHRRAYWPTDEPEDPPYVVAGNRYYFPVKGNGMAALDARQLDLYERQMVERKFSGEYLNNPLDEKRATFKRREFQILNVDDPAVWDRIPIEIRYGLGREVAPDEQMELSALGLSIQAFNWWDPAGKEEQSTRGDDTFGVATRTGRYGGIYVTWLSAGQWSASKTWGEVARGNAYNRPRFNDYEMGVDEKNCKPSWQKWVRDESERTGITPMIPMHWSHMPKSTKMGRIEKLETWTANGDFFILSNAGPPELIEKYIGQFLGLGVTGHDDGPDATSRGVKYFMSATYQKPPAPDAEPPTQTLSGGIPWGTLKGLGLPKAAKSWGETAL